MSKNKGNKDIWLLKINENGKIYWEKSIGGSELDEANSVIETKNNNLIIVGETWSSDFEIKENKGFSDALIIQIK